MNPPAMLITAWAILLACQGPTSGAQPTTAGSDVDSPRFEIQHATDDVRLRLQMVARDVDRGDWQSALQMLIQGIDEIGDELYQVRPDRLVPVRTVLQSQIASLPGPALESYRLLVDQQAEEWFAEAVANVDPRPLEWVVRRAFCSSWGDDALVALGDLAASRGWYATARHYWRRVHGGVGATRDADDAPGQLARSAPYLVYPDSGMHHAMLHARLILADVMADDWASAASGVDLFRRRYRHAEGELAGRHGPLVETLDQVMSEARDWPPPPISADWPTYCGTAARQRAIAPADRVIESVAWRYAVDAAHGGELPEDSVSATSSSEAFQARRRQAEPRWYPIVVDDLVLINDGRGIVGLHMGTGEPAFGGSTARVFSADSRQEVRAGDASTSQLIRHETLSAYDDHVYARVGEAGRIVCLDLSRQGKLVWQRAPDHDRGTFEGTPVADDTAVYVAMTVGHPEYEHFVVCLDARDGYPRWRTRIGRSDGRRSQSLIDDLLTLAEGRLYYNTNEGVVAALCPDDGSVVWIWTHDKGGVSPAKIQEKHPTRPSPAVFADGMLLVAPCNDRRVFAVTAATGYLRWTTQIDEPYRDIIGTVSGLIVVAGEALWGLDQRSGSVQWKWPERPTRERLPRARPVLVGQSVLWPAQQALYAVEIPVRPDAAVSRPRASRLELQNYAPGNMLYAQEHLIIAGARRIDCVAYAAKENGNQRRGPERAERKRD